MTTIRSLLLAAVVLTLCSLTSCMSLPAPKQDVLIKFPPLRSEAFKAIISNNDEKALEAFDKIIGLITDDGKLAGGKGLNFRDEAYYTSLKASVEFIRGKIESASKLWFESFSIQYEGASAEYSLDKKNAALQDAFTNAIAQTAAQVSAVKNKQPTYAYSVYNTAVPRPELMNIGGPQGTISRLPIQPEWYPFDRIVKLYNEVNNNTCTATVISPKIAISAAHCISTDGVEINPFALYIQHHGIYNRNRIKILEYYTHLGKNSKWDTIRKNDWVILILAEEFSAIGAVQVFREIPAEIFSGRQKIMLPGYSSDLRKGYYLTLHHGCEFKAGQGRSNGIFLTNCEHDKGSSGASIFTTTPPYRIVAIHTAGIISNNDEYSSVETFGQGFIGALEDIEKKYRFQGTKLVVDIEEVDKYSNLYRPKTISIEPLSLQKMPYISLPEIPTILESPKLQILPYIEPISAEQKKASP